MSPRNAVKVTPERDTPGANAKACAQPISSACGQRSDDRSFNRGASQSTTHIITPKAISRMVLRRSSQASFSS